MTTSAEIRTQLVDILRLDLVGPQPEDTQRTEEILDTAPSRFYLTGFLIPYNSSAADRADETVADELDEVGKTADEEADDQVSTRRSFFPSSIGLTVLLPPSIKQVGVRIDWANYQLLDEPEDPEERQGHAVFGSWQRVPHSENMPVDVSDGFRRDIPKSEGLQLRTAMRRISDPRLGEEVSALSVYVVNHRKAQTGPTKDAAFAFQVKLTLDCYQPFVPRPNLRGLFHDDPDEKTADIQYRDVVQHAVGHNVSVQPRVLNGTCKQVSTEWLPQSHVCKVDPVFFDDLDTDMQKLGAMDGAAIIATLAPLVQHFARFVQTQGNEIQSLAPNRQGHARDMVADTERLQQRMAQGLQLLKDPQVAQAFRIANRAVAAAFLHREAISKGIPPKEVPQWVSETRLRPAWRPFQIGFILINLAGLVDPHHRDREVVDLLFFPTGGGKTEAYLGLAAITLALRRLRNQGKDGGGVTVLMRYTLRLLTLDQWDRAAALICALELERKAATKDGKALGDHPFEMGLWVGQGATPNRLGQSNKPDEFSMRTRLRKWKEDDRRYGSPIPFQACPWCGEPFVPNSFDLAPDDRRPVDLHILCRNKRCDFRFKKSPTGLPMVCVDEPLYDHLPAFLIATVDKFASLPWLGASGKLLGKANRVQGDKYVGHDVGRVGEKLDAYLKPPELIIQDELHLISGPLGTMVGLYETALEAIACDGRGFKPKIIASTATVRRAPKQIQALFARRNAAIFPPAGLDYRDNFFSTTDEQNMDRSRLYLGVAAQGRSLKVSLMRTYLALLAGAQKLWEEEGGADNPDNPVDPYMTLLGYFNALRELGGSRRIVEDEIASRLTTCAERKRRDEENGCFSNRLKLRTPVELTSRETTANVAKGKARLSVPITDKNSADVALATNMISVGLDISRLGLMVMLGQPKTAAEYIQATSRVGRDVKRPGLVVSLLNVHRPRDRSHYENFGFWHRCFYRSVEAGSVTPFSARALDRGLAAVVVALARHLEPELTPSEGAHRIDQHREQLTQRIVEIVLNRVEDHQPEGQDIRRKRLKRFLENRVVYLLQTWESLAANKPLHYQREKGKNPTLLHSAGRKDVNDLTTEEEQFKIQWSLREVEPKVNLFLSYPKGYGKENT